MSAATRRTPANEAGLVLVVGDEAATELTGILEAGGYRTVTVGEAVTARDWLTAREPDAVVIAACAETPDTLLPLVTELRRDRLYRMTPILLLTERPEPRLLRSAFTAGCDDFLPRPLEPLVVLARLGGLVSKARYRRELERIRSELARYVSPRLRSLIEGHARHPRSSSEPVLINACILFTDIRGFTALSHAIPPEQLFDTVNRHLSLQVGTVYRHGGYVDTFGGDGLMAVFDRPSMARQACNCAIEILETVAARGEHAAGEEVPVSIGVHAGEVTVGNIGTGDHLDYTAIGAPVNIAARVCGAAGAGHALVSEAVRRHVDDERGLAFGAGEQRRIRGIDTPVLLYQLSRDPHHPPSA